MDLYWSMCIKFLQDFVAAEINVQLGLQAVYMFVHCITIYALNSRTENSKKPSNCFQSKWKPCMGFGSC